MFKNITINTILAVILQTSMLSKYIAIGSGIRLITAADSNFPPPNTVEKIVNQTVTY